MVGVELIALGMHFDSFGSICVPVPVLLVSMGIDVELGQEGLYIALILDGYKVSLEILGGGHLIVAVFLAWWFSASSTAW